MELLDRTQLIKKLLVDEPWHLQELVVGDKLIHDLSLHPSGLTERKSTGCEGRKARERLSRAGVKFCKKLHILCYYSRRECFITIKLRK